MIRTWIVSGETVSGVDVVGVGVGGVVPGGAFWPGSGLSSRSDSQIRSAESDHSTRFGSGA